MTPLSKYASQTKRTELTRRTMLTGGMSAALLSLTACAAAVSDPLPGASARPGRLVPTNPATPVPVEIPPAEISPMLTRVPVPPGTLTDLPGQGSLLAWTVDDGTSAAVISRYASFAETSGNRFTFFANGTYDAWTETADQLRPLVASGQIQMGNHTYSHADLTELSDSGIADELQRNHDFIGETFGVDARPYFRPPYGYHDDRVDAVAANLGYTVPTLWYGSLSDSGLITEQQIIDLANQWFLPQHVIIGHLNFEPVTAVFDQLQAVLTERNLTTVTLNDVFTSPGHP